MKKLLLPLLLASALVATTSSYAFADAPANGATAAPTVGNLLPRAKQEYTNMAVSYNGVYRPGFVVPTDPTKDGWKLVHEETFSKPFDFNKTPWVVDPMGKKSPWYVDEFSDDGEYYNILGGEGFKRIIHSMNVMRKSVTFGDNGWLTLELGAEDINKDGVPDAIPTLTVKNGDGIINVPAWNTGLLITNTKPLPPVYRIQYQVKMVAFGGKQDGKFAYDGKYNGYSQNPLTPCKTNYPWTRTNDYPQSGIIAPCGYPFGDVENENGYYLLVITDYAKPAPHNNIFIHSHRKVGFDIYTANAGWAKHYQVCNPKTGKLYNQIDSNGHGVNEIFYDGNEFRDPRFAYNQFVMPTPCGTYIGNNPDATIVSEVELKPEYIPGKAYTVAIERHKDGYVTEISGDFRNIGQATIRNFRPFISPDGKTSIWHYNQTPEEYDGHLNQKLTFTGKYGSFSKDMWPKGSAYPDHFIIGVPHLNYYEGRAIIDNIKLFVPAPGSKQ